MSEGYVLCGHKGTETGNAGVIYVPYVPLCRMLTPEQSREEQRKRYRNKTYAKVRLSNPNPRYRHKEGQVLGTKIVGGVPHYLLRIETLNTCSKSGMMTLMGVLSNAYVNIWFREDELGRFWRYDDKGELVGKEDLEYENT